jgi:hypothetical protein
MFRRLVKFTMNSFEFSTKNYGDGYAYNYTINFFSLSDKVRNKLINNDKCYMTYNFNDKVYPYFPEFTLVNKISRIYLISLFIKGKYFYVFHHKGGDKEAVLKYLALELS